MGVSDLAVPNSVVELSDDQLRVKASNSDFLGHAQRERKSARLSSAILDYKRPDGLNLVTLGSSWSVDIVLRPHNGVRRELIDLYNMVDSMQRRVQDLRSQDIKMFFGWWDAFVSLLETVFDVSNKVLIPWAVGSGSPPSVLNEAARNANKENVNAMLKEFDIILEQLSRRPPDESLAKIIKGLKHIHQLFLYMEAVESLIPEIIEAARSEKEVRRMEKKVATYLHKNGDPDYRQFHLLMVGRGMTTEVASTWKRVVPPVIRILAGAQKNSFASTHLRSVDKLALLE